MSKRFSNILSWKIAYTRFKIVLNCGLSSFTKVKMKKENVELLLIGVPTKETGRIYPKEVVQEALDKRGDRPLLGLIDMPNSMTVDLAKVAFEVRNVHITDTALVGDIHIFDTHMGKILKELEAIHATQYRMAGASAPMGSNEMVTNWTIICAAATARHAE